MLIIFFCVKNNAELKNKQCFLKLYRVLLKVKFLAAFKTLSQNLGALKFFFSTKLWFKEVTCMVSLFLVICSFKLSISKKMGKNDEKYMSMEWWTLLLFKYKITKVLKVKIGVFWKTRDGGASSLSISTSQFTWPAQITRKQWFPGLPSSSVTQL